MTIRNEQKPLNNSDEMGFTLREPHITSTANLWDRLSRFLIHDDPNESDRSLDHATRFRLGYSRLYGHVLNQHETLHPQIRGSDLSTDMSKMIEALENFAGSLTPSPSEVEFLEASAKKLQTASVIFNTSEEENPQILSEAWSQITNLAPEESFIIVGGWKGHAVVYQIVRKEEGFIFTIVNTGDDEPQSETRLARGETVLSTQHRYRHKGYLIKNISPKLLKHILPTRSNLVRDINTTLTTIDTICLRELRGSPHLGRLHYPQRRGNCGQKCLTSWLKEECIKKFGPVKGAHLYEQFRVYYSQKLSAEIDSIDNKASPDKLMAIYGANSERELDIAIMTRKKACQAVISQRKAKIDRLEQHLNQQQNPLFKEIYSQLILNGWPLQTKEEIEGLRKLIKRIEKQNQNPRELITLATDWKGEKTWGHFEESAPILLQLIDGGKLSKKAIDECPSTYSLLLSFLR